MVGIGRPFIYALAVDGQRGVEHALDIVSTETRFAMAQCGVTDVSSITKDVFVL